jgi:FkbM family methyltransferase
MSEDAKGANWLAGLKSRFLARAIHTVCGSTTTITPAVADMPLMSAGLRFVWLRALGALGIKRFVSRSGLGYDFVCHVGDMAEFPFYHPRAFEKELLLCDSWLRQESEPIVYDVGANVGFFATHLAQMLASQSPRIYAFEPVPTTFMKLSHSVERLGLQDSVQPVAAAVIDGQKPVRINYSDRNSLYAQITPEGVNSHPRVGTERAEAAGIALDEFYAGNGVFPALVKIDVEGSEAAVLRGAKELLSRADRPALLFELNPVTLAECGVPLASFRELLAGYTLHYVDDMEGQKRPFGSPVERVEDVPSGCNLFAVPRTDAAAARWNVALARSERKLADRMN